MKKVHVTQDRFKPFGYYISQEINGLTFKTESIHSLEDINRKGFEIISRKDWLDGVGFMNIKIVNYFAVKDYDKTLAVIKTTGDSRQFEKAVMNAIIENYVVDDVAIDKSLKLNEIPGEGIEIEATLFVDDEEPTTEQIFIEPVLIYE